MSKSEHRFPEITIIFVHTFHSRVWAEKQDVKELHKANAKVCDPAVMLLYVMIDDLQFFMCGSGKVASGVKKTLVDMIREDNDLDEAAAIARFSEITKGRYATDIFD